MLFPYCLYFKKNKVYQMLLYVPKKKCDLGFVVEVMHIP